jgi:hypothetical protein
MRLRTVGVKNFSNGEAVKVKRDMLLSILNSGAIIIILFEYVQNMGKIF